MKQRTLRPIEAKLEVTEEESVMLMRTGPFQSALPPVFVTVEVAAPSTSLEERIDACRRRWEEQHGERWPLKPAFWHKREMA